MDPHNRIPGPDLPDGYAELLEDLKSRIQTARVKAMLAVNRELVLLYWQIGQSIVERQQAEGWGKAIIERLATDIQAAFPGLKGFSPSNIWRMRAFYLAYTKGTENLAQAARESPSGELAQLAREMDGVNLPQPLTDIPWFHNVIIIEKVKDPVQRIWYAHKTIEHGWSRAVLTVQIESMLYERHGKAVTNFDRTLPPPQSDLARQAVKDPYVFDFLNLADDAHERELESDLLNHIQEFLLELGVGFAFVGRQVHIGIGDQDFYIDLLFYHLRLRCFVVIELKMKEFKPEYAGKMNFYLSAVDDRMRHTDDQPSIGMILCKTRNRIVVEYALRDVIKPVGVAEWTTHLTTSLPGDLKGSLPTIPEIEAELQGGDEEGTDSDVSHP